MFVTGGAYQAWAAFLDRWAAGEPADPASLPTLKPEDFAGDSWARLTNRITEALSTRLVTWSETLVREIIAARDNFTVARALNHARWQLPPIRALAGVPALPDELRVKLVELVDGQIRSAQQQLDDAAEQLRRSGLPNAAVEAYRRTIRDNPLTAVTAAPHTTGSGWDAAPADRPRRRVILD